MSASTDDHRPPYWAVIFTSRRTRVESGYGRTADRMVELAREQPGFLGLESVREGTLGITVSYWRDEAAMAAWKANLEHRAAQAKGPGLWYESYRVRVARVERAYGIGDDPGVEAEG